MISLYLGGARSGKSSLAEQALGQLALPTTYIATATPSRSMAQRIHLHQQQRPASWHTIEAPLALSEALQQADAPNKAIIVDCLTLWLTNQLLAENDLNAAIDQLCQTLKSIKGPLVLVSTEVGQSLIPEDDISFAFVNASGVMHQKIAAIVDNVYFCQAKHPTVLKGKPFNTVTINKQPL